MRTIVEIEDADAAALDALARAQKLSRAALIRAAIRDFLARRRDVEAAAAFGLWGRRKVDGVAYQTKVRDEW
jgi:predicted transcriptional regulator